MNKWLLRMMATAVVLGFGLSAVPTASAQNLEATFSITSLTITPNKIAADTEIATANIEWVYTIQTNPSQVIGAVTTSTVLVWEPVKCDRPGIIVTGAFSQTISIGGQTGAPAQSKEGDSTFSVQATQDAPGETPIKCTFKGKVLALGNIQETAPAQSEAPIVVKYLGLLSASVPTTIKQAGPQKQIRYDIDLVNLGNSLTNVKFSLGEEKISGGWKPVTPTEVVLQSTQQGGTETTKTVSFLVSTPFKNGWNNKEDTFQLTITPTSAKDTSATPGNSITVSVLARVRGVYVPTIEPFLMLGAVLGAALVLRMKKD